MPAMRQPVETLANKATTKPQCINTVGKSVDLLFALCDLILFVMIFFSLKYLGTNDVNLSAHCKFKEI